MRNPLFCFKGLVSRMSIETVIEEIKAVIQPLFDERRVYLVDLELRGAPGSRVLKVYADTMSGITMEEIYRLTRDINDLLDIHDLIEGAYRLEVSSPGIERVFRKGWEFRKNLGRILRVIYREENGEQNEILGKLVLADEREITLKIKKTETTIPLSSIVGAKVQMKW